MTISLEVDIRCPACEHQFKCKLAEMSPNSTVNCPSCGRTITFTGDDPSKIQDALDDLHRTIEELNKTLTIKF